MTDQFEIHQRLEPEQKKVEIRDTAIAALEYFLVYQSDTNTNDGLAYPFNQSFQNSRTAKYHSPKQLAAFEDYKTSYMKATKDLEPTARSIVKDLQDLESGSTYNPTKHKFIKGLIDDLTSLQGSVFQNLDPEALKIVLDDDTEYNAFMSYLMEACLNSPKMRTAMEIALTVRAMRSIYHGSDISIEQEIALKSLPLDHASSDEADSITMSQKLSSQRIAALQKGEARPHTAVYNELLGEESAEWAKSEKIYNLVTQAAIEHSFNGQSIVQAFDIVMPKPADKQLTIEQQERQLLQEKALKQGMPKFSNAMERLLKQIRPVMIKAGITREDLEVIAERDDNTALEKVLNKISAGAKRPINRIPTKQATRAVFLLTESLAIKNRSLFGKAFKSTAQLLAKLIRKTDTAMV